MLCVEGVTQRRCTCFKFQVSSFRFQVSSFKFQFSSFSFQVSSFRFQVSSFKFQVSSLKLIFEIVLELVFELVFVVTSSEVENYRKDFTQSCTEFFFDMLCVERVTQRRCTCFRFQVSSFKFEVDLWSCSWTCSKCQIERSRDFIIIYKFNFARRDKN